MHKFDPHPAIEDRFLDHPYALAGRVIEPVPGTLSWQGKTAHLRRKELEILALLASVGGQVVSRQAFIAVVWDGNNMVGDHAITNTISSLRQALGDDDTDHPLIRTIPRRGYQLAVSVQPIVVPERAFLPGSTVPGSPGWRLVRRLSQPGVAESSASESWLAEPSAYNVDPDSTSRRVFRFCRSEAHLRRLQREITLLRYVSQSLENRPDIALIRDWQLDEPPYFVACDYATYGSLTDWVEAIGALPKASQAQLKLMIALSSALAALHAVGLVHRQFGADCILVDVTDAGPQLKISAFGSGALVDRRALESLKIAPNGLTLSEEEAQQSPRHAAPDWAPGDEPNTADDVYALGVVLVQLAVGELRTEATLEWPEWLARVQNPALKAHIAACLGPADKRPSAAELSAQLHSLDAAPEPIAAPLPTPDAAAIPKATPSAISPRPAEKSDTPEMIGHYRLLDRLGEGGMGTVYLAEQREPYRKVALKIVRSGLDGKQILARFDAERQALAMMNHPNVATVLESGLATDGRPFFAMEYIAGIDIGEYCDGHSLNLQARVKLFLQVCDGVLHAHQKGVLHRDIKPSNLMVSAVQDQPATVKVIDFGLAKSLQGKLVSQTLHTSFGAFMGTPIYCSPEHISGSVTGVDTRSDIYSMGVVLYELLAGLTPIANASLENLEHEKVRELVCNSVLPSMRNQLSNAPAERLVEIANKRATSAEALPQTLDGDLSWVVGKCLERDPNDRYASVLELKKDLERWLENRPVEARPTSRWYRFRKLVRRNRGAAIAICGALGLLFALTATSLYGYYRAQSALASESAALKAAERATLDATQALEFQVKQIKSMDPQAMGIGFRTALAQAVAKRSAQQKLDKIASQAADADLKRSLADVNFTDLAISQLDAHYFQPGLKLIDNEYSKSPKLQTALWQSTADTLSALGLHEQAMVPQEKAVVVRLEVFGANHSLTLESLIKKGELLVYLGKMPDAKVILEDAVARSRRATGLDNVQTLSALRILGLISEWLGKSSETGAYYREALHGSEQLLGKLDPQTLLYEADVGYWLLQQNRLSEAEPLIEHAYSQLQRKLGRSNIKTIDALTTLAVLREKQWRIDEAIVLGNLAIAEREVARGRYNRATLSSMNNQANLLSKAGRFDDALALFLDLSARQDASFAPRDPIYFLVQGSIGATLQKLGRLAEAEPYCRTAMEEMIKQTGPDSFYSTALTQIMANLLRTMGRFDDATNLYQQLIDMRLRAPEPKDRRMTALRDQLGRIFLAQGRLEAGAAMLAKALEDSRNVELGQPALTLAVQSHYSLTLPPRGSKPNAISLLIETVAQLRSAKGVALQDQIEAPTALAKLLNDENRALEAIKYAEQAVVLAQKTFPKGHYLWAAALTQQGRALIALGRGAEAKVGLSEAKKQIDNTEGLDPRYRRDLAAVLASK